MKHRDPLKTVQRNSEVATFAGTRVLLVIVVHLYTDMALRF